MQNQESDEEVRPRTKDTFRTPTMLAWEILYWVMRCPYVQSDDLAVLCGVTRATIVRHLRRLEHERLIEWVTPAFLTDHGTTSRLYYLADAGLHILATVIRTPNHLANGDTVGVLRTMAMRQADMKVVVGRPEDQQEARERLLARRWRTDERPLMHDLPRLGQIVRLDGFVRGLVVQAPKHLGERGYTAHGEWNWERFYRLGASNICHVKVDGVIAFHVDGIGGVANSPLWRADRWHTALIVADSALQDWRGSAQTLQMLGRIWGHENADSVSDLELPPVLLLASSERHLERWLRIALQIVPRLAHPDEERLFGAVAVIPGPLADRLGPKHGLGSWDRDTDPWHAAWRNLKDGRPVSLRQVLNPPSARETLLTGIAFPTRRDVSSSRIADPPPQVARGGAGSSVQKSMPREALQTNQLPAPVPEISMQSPAPEMPTIAPSHAFAVMRQRRRLCHIIQGRFEARARAVPVAPSTVAAWGQSSQSPQGLRQIPHPKSSSSAKPGLRQQRQHLCLLSLRLPGRFAQIVDLVYRMPGILPSDLAAFLDLKLGSVESYLNSLNQMGLFCCPSAQILHTSRPVRPTVVSDLPMPLVLSRHGVHFVALRHDLSMRSRLIQHALAMAGVVEAELQAPGATVGKRMLLSHDSGVYHFLALLTQTARALNRPEPSNRSGQAGAGRQGHVEQEDRQDRQDRLQRARLVWSETGSLAQHRYLYENSWHNLRPDAVGLYRLGNVSFRFWLEWDQGTMNVDDLTRKLHSYATYLHSGQWRPDHGVLPHLLIVVPNRIQLERMRLAAAKAALEIKETDLASSAHHLACSVTLQEWLNGEGPLAPIWWPLLPRKVRVTSPDMSERPRRSQAHYQNSSEVGSARAPITRSSVFPLSAR